MRSRILGVLLGSWLGVVGAAEPGTIHGTVRTRSGREVSGRIVWNDARLWIDRLEAAKEQPAAAEERGFHLEILGIEIGGGPPARATASLSVPFGELRSVETAAGDRATLTLKNGDVIEARSAGSGVGSQVRLVVEPAGGGERRLAWDVIDRVDFRAGPDGDPDRSRLYGVVEAAGGSFRGFVVWDRDESTGAETLDGSEGDEYHRIPFSRVRAIERVAGGSRVTLDDGSQLVLGGTNDVDEGQRGTVVRDATGVTVTVEWSDFKKVSFTEPPVPPGYASFDGGRRLHGRVTTAEGRTIAGDLVWDRDERYTWEMLDGDAGGVSYSIPFRAIGSIRPLADGSCAVTLRDGRELELSGSNDVDEGYRGLLVSDASGTEVVLERSEVRSVSFDPPLPEE